MPVITIYQCDKCGAEQPTPEQFWRVAVTIASFASHGYHNEIARHSAGWCRKCIEDAHMLPRADDRKAEPLPEAPTLEDLVREIAREEITEATGAV
jgi:hypothetical protein